MVASKFGQQKFPSSLSQMDQQQSTAMDEANGESQMTLGEDKMRRGERRMKSTMNMDEHRHS